MQVFTVHPANLPTAIHSGNNGANYPSSGTAAGTNMIQAQPINLATNNISAVRRPADPYERAGTFRHEPTPLHVPSSSRTVNQNPGEHQPQDLSIHAQLKPTESTPTAPIDRLLEFCNIILKYTNYPEAFGGELEAGTQEGSKNGKSPQAAMKKDSTVLRPPQKRKNSIPTVKQKPGRKPKASKSLPPVPRLQPEPPTHEHVETASASMNGSRRKEGRKEGKHVKRSRERKVSSPLNSVGESREGTHSSSCSTSSHAEERESQNSNLFYPDDDRDESWEQVTCFCGKPFAGRPMIECESCFVWHHMSCAKLRKTNVPKKFYCKDCRHMFPEYVQVRQRRTSATAQNDRYPKTPLKSATVTGAYGKNGPSHVKTEIKMEVTTPPSRSSPPPLNSPPPAMIHPPIKEEPITPPVKVEPLTPPVKVEPLSPPKPHRSLYFTPTEVKFMKRIPPGSKFRPDPPSAPTTPQSQNGQPQLVNGNSGVMHAQNNSAQFSTQMDNPTRKAPEPTKRRPTLNSASSGLYDDVLLPLPFNFSSRGNNSQNGTSSS